MKQLTVYLTGLLILILIVPVYSDFSIRSGNNWEREPVVVYNSTNNEYLVVWSEFSPFGNGSYIIGPVMGQRLSIEGQKVGTAFQIFDMATSPSVAYNSKANEYLVAVQGAGGVHGQRISNTGGKVAGDVLLMSNADYPQVLYNDLANEYFLTAYVYATPHNNIYARRIGAEIQILHPTKDLLVWDDSTFSITYAPIAPNGRYLFSDWSKGHRLLDSGGNLIQTIGFETGFPKYGYVDGEGYSGSNGINSVVDVAFGYKDGNPVFMVVYADNNNKWPWPEVEVTGLMCGVWGGYIDAVNPPSQVTNSFFPIPDIPLVRHCSAKWKPKVVYNPSAQKFIVTWNETPTTAVGNDATVNHIRATNEFTNVSGFVNVVLSATTGSENPDYPVIATSTKSANALVVWEDKRNFSRKDVDIYGTIYSISVAPPPQSIIVDAPNGGESWETDTPQPIVWHTQNFTGNVKIEISTDGGSTWTIIANNLSTSAASYMWTVSNTPSTNCRIRISDASDGNPSDISDADFTITSNEAIIIDAPNGGESWSIGTPQPIVWHTHIFTGSVKIELSTYNNGSSSWTTIANNFPTPTANTATSYIWTVSNTPSTDCFVKISDASSGNPYDISDNKFTISASGGNNTNTGTNIQVNLGSDVTITFDNVTVAGNTTLNQKTSGSPPPSGFQIVPSGSPVYYDINTTATFTGNIKICIKYNDSGMSATQEASLKLQVYEVPPGSWKDITKSVDATANIICGEVTHLTDFAVMSPTGGSTTQTTSLPQGWSWISFNVKPSDLSVENVFSGVTNLAIVVNNNGDFYMPGVVNSIGNLNVLEGYKIYVTAADQVSVAGQQVSATTPVNLASGWNLVSYVPTTSKPVETALASILSQLAIVQNDEGNFYIPSVVNSLGNMAPGEGYKMYLNSSATLIYPSGLSAPKLSMNTPVSKKLRPSHFKFKHRTGQFYSVVVHSINVAGIELQTGDEIGIFTKTGICVGAGVWDGSGRLGISCWQDDDQTDLTDGYRKNELMQFKFWDSNNELEIPLNANFSIGNGNFGNGAYSIVELGSDRNIVSGYNLEQNSPNPFNAQTRITYHLSKPEKVELKVFSLLGEEIKSLVSERKSAGSYSVVWDGLDVLGNNVPTGVYIFHLIAGEFSTIRKAILIK